MLWLDHGPDPSGAGYHYIVVPGIATGELAGYAKKHPTRVLANSPSLQAVLHEGLRLTQAVFYKPGRTESKGDNLSLSVDKPCAVLAQEKAGNVHLAVAGPAQRLKVVHVEVNRKLKGDGCEWVAEKGISRIRLGLPGGHFAGKSVVRDFKVVR
jgi:chondroitin AC lyase